MPPALTRSIKALPRQHWEKLLLLALPFLFASINPNWLVGKNDVDIWFYYGYFHHYLDFWNSYSPDFARTYYGTRLPYTLPGSMVYSLFGSEAARYVFHLLILSSATIFSFWYVARTHTSRSVAFIVSAIFAADIFFIRSIGSDYVDNGVLVYQILTFALLTKACQSPRSWLFLIVAGFTATSMVVVHLLSVVFLPVFLVYYCYFSQSAGSMKSLWTHILYTLKWVVLGAAICLVFYGLVFVIQVNGPFLFFIPQMKMLFKDSTSVYENPLTMLLRDGYWLVTHVAVAVASALTALYLYATKRPVSKSVRFWLLAGPTLYATLAILQPSGLWFLASRSGFYATFFLPLTYLGLASLLFRDTSVRMGTAAALAIVFIGSMALRLAFGNGESFQTTFPILMWPITLATGIVCLGGSLLSCRNPRYGIAAAFLIGVITVSIPWKFDGNPSIAFAHKIVSNHAQGRLPKFFWSKTTEVARHEDFSSIAATFTERAWWQRGVAFPDCHQIDGGSIDPGDLIVLMTSTDASKNDLRNFETCIGPHSSLGKSTVKDAHGEYQLSFFEISADADTLSYSGRGADLPGQVGTIEGAKRSAQADKTPAGILTYGPYVALQPGRYVLSISYAATSSSNHWDATWERRKEATTVGPYTMPDTGGKTAVLTQEITIEQRVSDLQIRTFFAGQSSLSIDRVTVRRINTPSDVDARAKR